MSDSKAKFTTYNPPSKDTKFKQIRDRHADMYHSSAYTKEDAMNLNKKLTSNSINLKKAKYDTSQSVTESKDLSAYSHLKKGKINP